MIYSGPVHYYKFKGWFFGKLDVFPMSALSIQRKKVSRDIKHRDNNVFLFSSRVFIVQMFSLKSRHDNTNL